MMDLVKIYTGIEYTAAAVLFGPPLRVKWRLDMTIANVMANGDHAW